MIKFGTDGWRAIIDKEFNFANVKSVTQAVAGYLKEGRVIVGYDTRRLSPEFAQAVSRVLAANKIEVVLADDFVPTPVVSFSVKEKRARAGIMITASHNPAEYNGLKIKDSFGGPLSGEETGLIESLIGRESVREASADDPLIKREDLSRPYLESVKRFIKWDSWGNKKLKAILDNMHGAGGRYLSLAIGEGDHTEIVPIRSGRDISFGGIHPEPIEENLGLLKETVKANNADIGLATDGDADRLGVVDGNGNYVSSQTVFSLLLLNFLESRPWRGGVVKSVACTFLIDKIAEKFKLPVYETGIGFKYAVPFMREQDIIMAGEESGGYGFKGRPPERDGIVSGLLLLEMIKRRRQALADIVGEMEKEYGTFNYGRKDHVCSPERKTAVLAELRKELPDKIAGKKVVKKNTRDGYKLILEDNSWMLLRFSGTEPKLRIYAESASSAETKELLFEGEKIVKGSDSLV